MFNWLELVLKPVNHESTSKILEVSKEHAQQKPHADCCCGFSRAVNKPTTRETSHTNDFVITGGQAGEKTLLQGITFVFVRFLPISGYFKCYTCLAIEILLYHLECCQTFWVCCILWNFPQLMDNIFFLSFSMYIYWINFLSMVQSVFSFVYWIMCDIEIEKREKQFSQKKFNPKRTL